MKDIHQILQQYWGYPAFRPLQEDIINSVLQGNDTLALLPTGGGKSICFQVPAMALEGVCLVVSPLIALMKDQVEQLRSRGIAAQAIYSGMKKNEIDIALDNCVYGSTKFLYISPERLKTEIMKERAKKMPICLLAIDEAHCISQWGYDFRPPYLEIAEFRELLPQPVPCLALTATATPEVRDDIMEKLAFPEPRVFQKSFARSNLSYSVLQEEDKEGRLVKILQSVAGTAIVYVRSRKRTQQISDWLCKYQINADYYHAGISNELRSRKQEAWIQNKTRVMVATNAFGMGIDKSDVRLVVHIDLPETLEAYYQEAGRGGRDEQMAYATVLCQAADWTELPKRVATTYPELEQIKRTYQALANFYKIAVGSSLMATYDFDFDDFIQTYKLNYTATYYSIKRLEEQGLIQLNEPYYSPSRMMFAVGKSQLYEFQVANEKQEAFVKTLLRVYGGELFTSYLTISEQRLAILTKSSKAEVIKRLRFMEKMGVIRYEAQKDKPQMTFLQERASTSNFPFNLKAYQARRNHDLEKAKATAAYMANKEVCRTRLLLAYFGEDYSEQCGICDYCLSAKRQQKKAKGDLPTIIKQCLTKAPQSIEDLLPQLGGHFAKSEATEMIRQMLDSGELCYLANGKLALAEG